METLGFSGTVSGLSSVVNKTKRRRKENLSTELTHSRLGLLTLYGPPQPRVEYAPWATILSIADDELMITSV